MGLDMYLTARHFVSEFSDKELSTKLTELANGIVKGRRVNGITVEAMYWRKANAIHNWFVKNVQDGIDDCKEYHVPADKLKLLLDVVNDVLERKETPAEALPTSSGFFFGEADYNEWYWEGLTRTKEDLTALLLDFGDDNWNWNFYYQSSW